MTNSLLKRLLAFALFSVFAAVLCISCAGGEAEEIVPEYSSTIPGEIDLNNKTFVFGMVKDYFFEGKDSVLTYIYNTEFADLALKRIQDVENRHNCKIEFRYYDRASDAAYIDVLSNTYRNDLIQEETYWLANYIPTGMFVDLTTLDHIDVTNEEKWGSRQLLLPSMWNGEMYGVVPAMHPLRTQNSVSGLIGINEDYIKIMGVTDPRDFYENKTWNWDTFTTVLTDYTFVALSGDKIPSFSADASRFIRCVAFSNGDDFVKYNSEDGTFELGLFSTTALTALNQWYDWMNGPTRDSMDVTTETNQYYGVDALNGGNCVMGHLEAFQVLSNTSSIAYNLDNFGLVPYPYGPDAEPGWYKTYCESTDFTICIPVTAEDPEATAVVMDALYEPFEGYETRDALIYYLDKNYFLDTRDSELFAEVADPSRAYYLPTTNGLYDVWPDLWSRTPAESLAKYKDLMYSKAEQYLLPQISTMYEVYGG